MKAWFATAKLIACTTGLMALSACASGARSAPRDAGPPPSFEQSMEAVREIEMEIIEADAELKPDDGDGAERRASRPKIPLEINERVHKWIHYFSVTDRERFHRFLKRGSIYKETVHRILRENGVPRELYYLAMIESGYVTHAKSRAKAVGPWQFIRGTGLRYGLKQGHYLDERRDIIRSTVAAARYLKALYTAFQSWYLAMASYNAGEGRILGAIIRGSSRDFWTLVEKKALPPETRNYVPKFLAAVIIGRHPEKYGFHDIDSGGSAFPKVEEAAVWGGLRLGTIASKLGVPFKTLKEINPHLVRSMTPTSLETYPIWVPEGMAEKLKRLQPALAKHRLRGRARAARAVASGGRHKVRRGETLASIARRYRMSVAALRRINRMRSDRIYVGRTIKVAASGDDGQNVTHKVRPGEALSVISHRYKVPVSRLKRVNRLRGNRIFAGQRLIIPIEI